MGAGKTRMSANISIDHMLKIGFMPKTILNIGVGSCPELSVWRKRLSEVSLLGVDIRHRRWDAPCVHALVSDTNAKDAMFCSVCRSVKCLDINHPKSKVDAIKTIDNIVLETKVQAPFFLWIDIEGGELDALKGAKDTLPKVPLINIEMREFVWTNTNCSELHSFLVSSGYFMVDIGVTSLPLEDKLYQRIDWKVEK